MASPRRQKYNACEICNTMIGVFLCHGCEQSFCSEHTQQHRHVLQQAMNGVMDGCDRLMDDIQEHTTGHYNVSLSQYIDQWERDSLNKIQQLAREIREQASMITQDNADNLKEKLEELRLELYSAQQNGGFYESDVERWSRRLDELRNFIVAQQQLIVENDSDLTPFISRIALNDTRNIRNKSKTPTERNTPIKPNISPEYRIPTAQNTPIKPNISTEYPIPSEHNTPIKPNILTENKKKNEYLPSRSNYSENPTGDRYSSGKHTLRYKIDSFDPNSSVDFGIISNKKGIELHQRESTTFYGWKDDDIVCRGVVSEKNYGGYQSDFQTNDIYQLVIDCDQRKIRIKNERTAISYDLLVDTTKCPLPWQPHVRIITNFE